MGSFLYLCGGFVIHATYFLCERVGVMPAFFCNCMIFTLLLVCLWKKYYICGSRSGDDDFVRLRSSVQLLA